MIIARNPLALFFVAAMACAVAAPTAASAQTSFGQALTIGSPNVAVADPLVPRPTTTPCVVTLFDNLKFADYNDKPYTFTPPAGCPGPWQKVVFTADFNVTAGRQFDRTARVWLGNAVIYFGTTQEPSHTVAPSWHVERDLTDYSALFTQPQNGSASLGNFVGTSGGVTYDGIIYGSATLEFYPAVDAFFLPPRPDSVVSLNTQGIATLVTPTDQLAAALTLPTNIERAFLDVYPQSQNADEFWFFDLPDDIASIFQDTGSTAFKEALVTIDGAPAGIAPIYPWIYTGGADPILWRPTPGVQTLAFEPYRVDLTPFAGVLSDGSAHTFAVSVFDAANYFSTAATLLLYLDHGGSTVTGSVTANSLTATPVVNVVENIVQASDGSASGPVSVTSNRQFTITGTAKTSHGTVTTQIDTAIAFSSVQQLLTNATDYKQDTVQNTTITKTTTRTIDNNWPVIMHEVRNYPLTFDYDQIGAADGSFTLHSHVDQEFQQAYDTEVIGEPPASSTRDNHVISDVLRSYDSSGSLVSAPAASSQTYTFQDPFGPCYSRSIATENRLLTSVTDGAGCYNNQNYLSWFDLYDDYAWVYYGVKLFP